MASIEDSIDLDFDSNEDDLLINMEKSDQKLHRSTLSRLPLVYHSEDASGEHREKNRQREPVKFHVNANLFGIESETHDERYNITKEEMKELYESMGINELTKESYRLNSVFLRGIDDLNEYEIERMFAEFSPSHVEIIDSTTCDVIWNSRFVVAKMMLEMTKPVRRVRGEREFEEGEVHDDSDEEEDGEMKEECGDDVTINFKKKGEKRPLAKTSDKFIEVDVDFVDVPPGKWRAITKHVKQNRLIILKFSLWAEVARRYKEANRLCRSASSGSNSYQRPIKKARIRPGLNIFTEAGEELEWDYEHDTRFYVEDKSSSSNFEKTTETKGSSELLLGKRKIISRGRGAKHLKCLDGVPSIIDSMAADDEEKSRVSKSSCHA